MHKIIVMTDFSESNGKNLLSGIAKYAKENGPWEFCRIPSSYQETRGINHLLPWAKEWGANGVIGQFYQAEHASLFLQEGIAVIAQDFRQRLPNVTNISGDYHATGEMGAAYFLKKGFQHFAFYGFSDVVWSHERAGGFEKAVAQKGYKVHFFYNSASRPPQLWPSICTDLSQWLKALPKPVAVMACNDNQGQLVIQACQQSGIRVPQEVAVLGVDNDDMVCGLSATGLSSICLDMEKAGYEVAALLDKMVVGKVEKSNDIIVKPTQIISRQSTDIYATADSNISSTLRYIHQNIDDKLTVEKILSQVPLSRSVLEKRFQQTTGLPVYKYIHHLRVEKFTKELLETNKSIFEIALELGFEDSKNIARSFKKIKGCTPIEYRQKYQLKKTSY
jgi:LacI family transcriptional regulator